MRKFWALLALCLLWTTPIVSQTKTDKEREGLVGPVKSVKAFLIIDGKRRPWHTTTYNNEGNISERVSYDPSGEITARYVHTYDANGRNTGYEEYAATLDKTLTIPRRHVYTLNEAGLKVEYTVFESDGSFGTRFVYKYDAKGNLTEDLWYAHTGQLGGRQVSTFDENGNQTSQTSYQGESTLHWKNVSKFDANGNRTEVIQYHGKTLKYKVLSSYDSNGRVLEQEIAEFNRPPNALPASHAPEPGKIVYTYNDDKRTKEVATYKLDGTLKEKIAYAYDERKNEVGLTMFNADGSTKNGETRSINIEYDSYGNWTRKTRLIQSENGGPPQANYAELRVISYY